MGTILSVGNGGEHGSSVLLCRLLGGLRQRHASAGQDEATSKKDSSRKFLSGPAQQRQ
jgi:hypothetical protein